MAKGRTLNHFAVSIGVAESTVNNWIERHEEFKKAYEVACGASQAYWEEIAHDQATGAIKGGNASTLTFMMKNQFNDKYKDKQEVEHKGDLTFIIDTGIRREKLPAPIDDAIEAEVKKIDDDSDLL